MATNRPQLPNPALFTSDPIEHVYAGELPKLGGLAYMFLNAAEDRRDAGQQDYSQQVDKANSMSMALARMEEDFKHRQEVMKVAGTLMGHGVLPSNLNGAGDLISNMPGADADVKTITDLRRAQATEALAKGANAGAGNFEVDTDVAPDGVGITKLKAKGSGAASAIEQELARRNLKPTQVSNAALQYGTTGNNRYAP